MSDSLGNISSQEENNNLILKSNDDIFVSKMYLEDTWDGSYFVKFIKSVESKVRTSDEYSNYVGYLKNDCKLNHCAILGHINDEMAEIEFHHYPFNLYEICSIVTVKKILEHEKVSTFLVADEVIKLHYSNLVGVVPLCKTVHKLFHAGQIFINLDQVFGDVYKFINIYKKGINEDLIQSYNKIVKLSKNKVAYNENDILKLAKTSWITKTPDYYKEDN